MGNKVIKVKYKKLNSDFRLINSLRFVVTNVKRSRNAMSDISKLGYRLVFSSRKFFGFNFLLLGTLLNKGVFLNLTAKRYMYNFYYLFINNQIKGKVNVPKNDYNGYDNNKFMFLRR